MTSAPFQVNRRSLLISSDCYPNPSSSHEQSNLSSRLALQSSFPLKTLSEHSTQDFFPSVSQCKAINLEPKPFSLPSLASLTANLSTNLTGSEQHSNTGPHRQSLCLGVSTGRRFSPLGNNSDYYDLDSPLDSERSIPSLSERHSNSSMFSTMIASGNRSRSRSLLSGNSITGIRSGSDLQNEESSSDSGSSEKKRDLEEDELVNSSKKRSRTLTTPMQQRRLVKVLEQTRFPSTELREQLAQELNMTPRRVQIWFQNRRQGMKKAVEQKTDQEPSALTAGDLNQIRGYSFGAYPTPPTDAYAFHLSPSTQPQQVSGSSLIQYKPSSISSQSSLSLDALKVQPSQPFAPRCGNRFALSRLPPHSQYETSYSPGQINESGGSITDFPWSESSGPSSSYSLSSGMDRDNIELPGLNPVGSQQPNGFRTDTGDTPIQRLLTQHDYSPSKSIFWSENHNQSIWNESLSNLKLDSAINESNSSMAPSNLIFGMSQGTVNGLYYQDAQNQTGSFEGNSNSLFGLLSRSFNAENSNDSSATIEDLDSPDQNLTDSQQQVRQRSHSLNV
ncbi:hypothetical protein O181_051634 [Austropuccinia psidii MF-1]|uniref:Homeobox domain-containing protein n=1 Tax=Austropuccinia psidii MF-1 TaxID=1389203 RepID=A0A9Q3DZ66_9BASI|nr:hypothetical protein [Austropuccinia psidii MF-1]